MPQSNGITNPRQNDRWRHLPHNNEPGYIQAITFRLADSMPAHLRSEWEQLLRITQPLTQQAKIQAYIDNGYGSCILRHSPIADIVETCVRRHDKSKYLLLAWVIMPNHVHAMIRPLEDCKLSSIVGDWKSYSARLINVELHRDGAIWHRDYFDRFIRDEKHLERATTYIHQNPVKAGLVTNPKDWPHSSAGLVESVEMTVCNPWEAGEQFT